MQDNHEEYLTYHRELAEMHPELKHGLEGRKSWAGTEEDEHASVGVSSKAHTRLMFMLPLFGQVKSSGDFHRDEMSGGFIIFVRPVDANQNFTSRNAAYSLAKKIGFQIVMRIHEDSRNSCPWMTAFDPGKVKYEQADVFKDNYYGYIFQFPILVTEGLEYEEGIWQ